MNVDYTYSSEKPNFFWGKSENSKQYALFEPVYARLIMVSPNVNILNQIQILYNSRFPLMIVCSIDNPDQYNLDNSCCHHWSVDFNYSLTKESSATLHNIIYNVTPLDQSYDPESVGQCELILKQQEDFFFLYNLLEKLYDLETSIFYYVTGTNLIYDRDFYRAMAENFEEYDNIFYAAKKLRLFEKVKIELFQILAIEGQLDNLDSNPKIIELVNQL